MRSKREIAKLMALGIMTKRKGEGGGEARAGSSAGCAGDHIINGGDGGSAEGATRVVARGVAVPAARNARGVAVPDAEELSALPTSPQ